MKCHDLFSLKNKKKKKISECHLLQLLLRLNGLKLTIFQIITLDRGIIEMGADVYYSISNVEKSVTSVQDLNTSIRALLRNVLMNHVVKFELEHIEAQKYNIITNVMVGILCIENIHFYGVIRKMSSVLSRWKKVPQLVGALFSIWTVLELEL